MAFVVKIAKNIYLDSLFKLMLLSASIHMIILIGAAILRADIKILNYFNIPDLEFIFPHIVDGFASDVASALVAAAIYGVFLYRNKRA